VRRRTFIAGLGYAAAWPVMARAQQPAMPVVGFLSAQSADDSKFLTVPVLQGLKETGYVEGQNVAVEYRWAENQYDRLPALAADLVRRPVAVIVAAGNDSALAAKGATTTIPIVFTAAGAPVALGFVASLNRPGANLTGIVTLSSELAPKQLQLLRELIPNAAAFGVLADPAPRMEQLSALAARHALPAIYPYREFTQAGGLMSYGSSLGYLWHQLGIYTGRILKGEKPADLKVLQWCNWGRTLCELGGAPRASAQRFGTPLALFTNLRESTHRAPPLGLMAHTRFRH
jgi:putative tryptophan/tyrosine transport system substrate-binding protein